MEWIVELLAIAAALVLASIVLRAVCCDTRPKREANQAPVRYTESERTTRAIAYLCKQEIKRLESILVDELGYVNSSDVSDTHSRGAISVSRQYHDSDIDYIARLEQEIERARSYLKTEEPKAKKKK